VPRDVILSEAKNPVFKPANNLRDSSSPAAPQNDKLAASFINLLGFFTLTPPGEREKELG
jgi:hypothetical protein